ncbi:MAG: hypothetical protein LLG40_00215 [Deltaproteobacteria bacterium]|nr:hypothetical protein [Deltaproteobacteria bacterium]
MVTKKYQTAGLILAAAVAAVLLLFVDWEARAVKKQLRSIAGEMTWSSADSDLTMASRIRHVQERIAPNCQVEIPAYEISQSVDKKDVPAYLMIARKYYKNISVKLEDLKVESIRLPQAKAVTTAYIKATGADGQRNDEVLMLEFTLQKVEKKWLITSATEVQVLEK